MTGYTIARTAYMLPLRGNMMEYLETALHVFFVRKNFISNLVLDSRKFKKLLELQGKARNSRQMAHGNRYLVQRKALSKQCEYEIALEFNSYSSASQEETGARASICTCTIVCMSNCSYFFGIARAVLSLKYTKCPI